MPDEVRTAEVVGCLCLATDLAIGFPFEHGLQSTLVAMRLASRLGVSPEVAEQTFYGCMLFYIGCTTDAEIVAEMFPEGALLEHFSAVMFGSPVELTRGIVRALGDPGRPPVVRALQGVTRLPGATRGHRRHMVAMCQVAEMLAARLGMPPEVVGLVRGYTARWDGRSPPGDLSGESIPLALRIAQVARDATLQHLLGGADRAARVMAARAGKAFDPEIVRALLQAPDQMLLADDTGSVWSEVLAMEPGRLALRDTEVDEALSAMGDFADLVSSYFVGHSAGVAHLADEAAARLGLTPDEVRTVRRAGFVHDVGRVAVSSAVWNKPGSFSADEWERVRLHAYNSERVLAASSALSPLASAVGTHHERLDGSGYHRGTTGAMLGMPARVLAAADAYHTLIESRPHRPARTPEEAAEALGGSASAGLLDADAVAAVLSAAGGRVPHIVGPAGLTHREVQVVALVARGFQTKQVAHRLGISAKTADRHLQNAYAKIGVSTRAAVAVFAMQHGLVWWGELPIPAASRRP